MEKYTFVLASLCYFDTFFIMKTNSLSPPFSVILKKFLLSLSLIYSSRFKNNTSFQFISLILLTIWLWIFHSLLATKLSLKKLS